MFFLTPKRETVYEQIDSKISNVMEKMENHGLTAIPVIDSEGRYAGTVTEGDILRLVKQDSGNTFDWVSQKPVGAITRRARHESVRVDEVFDNLVKLTISQNYVPVVDDQGIYIGIITRSDIIEYLYNTRINKPLKGSLIKG